MNEAFYLKLQALESMAAVHLTISRISERIKADIEAENALNVLDVRL
jgi:hypothetical protein